MYGDRITTGTALIKSVVVAALLPLVSACGLDSTPEESARNKTRSIEAPSANRASDGAEPTSANAPVVTDGWAGRWNGPEGLFLDIGLAGGTASGRYKLTIKNSLDSQARYEGQAEGDTIRFVRGGRALRIRAGSGAETGFKWLADERDCLIVEADREGYCRMASR